jgi:hypothetical protein
MFQTAFPNIEEQYQNGPEEEPADSGAPDASSEDESEVSLSRDSSNGEDGTGDASEAEDTSVTAAQ